MNPSKTYLINSYWNYLYLFQYYEMKAHNLKMMPSGRRKNGVCLLIHILIIFCSYTHENSGDIAGDIEENYSKECAYPNGFVRQAIEFRTSNNLIIPYFDLSFDKIRDELITEIIIGSKCEASIFDIELILAAHGYNVKPNMVRKSHATYR